MTTALNKSTYRPTEIIDINKTDRRISKLSATIWSILSVITIIVGIALESLALAILGTIGLSITLVLAFSCKKIDPPKFQTVTRGEPFYITPAPVIPIPTPAPVVIPEAMPAKSPLASDYNEPSLPVVVEQPHDEEKEKQKAEHEEKLAEDKVPPNPPSTPTPGEVIEEYDAAPGMKTPERVATPTATPAEMPPIGIASAKDTPPSRRTLFGNLFTTGATPK